MNNLRQFCAALILTLALAASTFAGNIECPGIVGSSSPSAEAVAGDMPNGVASTQPEGTATDMFLSLLQSLLALF